MSLVFVNDPKFDELPLVGGVPALLALRTSCGVAVRWDPATGSPDDLSAFLGDEFVSFEGRVMHRVANGSLIPVDWALRSVVVVRPPAGDVFTVDGSVEALTSQFAIVVDVPATVVEVPVDEDGDGVIDVYEAQTVADLAGVLRERGLQVSGTKAELVARLHDDDKAKAAEQLPPPEPQPVDADGVPIPAPAGDAAPVS